MVHENLVTIYIYIKEHLVRLFTHDKSETPTPRPITPNEEKKKREESHNFLNFPRF